MKPKKNLFGMIRIATAVPRIKVADPTFNAGAIISLMEQAAGKHVDILVFPELSLTGYTCGDLFHQSTLRQGALEALDRVVTASADKRGIFLVGLPLQVEDKLFNCAAVINRGKILGIVPKSYIPGYKEFYEPRWFSPASAVTAKEVTIGDTTVPFGTDLLFFATDFPGLVFGAEICEDLWVPIPPSVMQSLAGAVIHLNLSASNERIGKAPYRRGLVTDHSARVVSVYAYTSCGVHESTTDVVFSGHQMIAENGGIVAEAKRFQRDDVMQFADVDIERVQYDRLISNSFAETQRVYAQFLNFRRIGFACEKEEAPKKLQRNVEAHPFVPAGKLALRERCEEIFNIQVAGLCKRLEQAKVRDSHVTIGVSGGLDSTLALLVVCKAFDLLGIPRTQIHGYTMPGFGTTDRTKGNALALMRDLGITSRQVDIRAMCYEHWKAVGHKPFGIDLSTLTLADFTDKLKDVDGSAQDLRFENVQARMRTDILMNAGFVIGTGDLSELALGWCTYNGDHMSMYNPNCSIPKTLVKFLVHWAAEHQFEGDARKVLLDIFNTEISPELLPTGRDGKTKQKTEKVVGPYELHDFFLYHILRFGMHPQKIVYLATQARFHEEYSEATIRHWLRIFLNRFFNSQFKRSCVPDGPKVGSVSLSPRGDWRMPSDASVNLWLEWLNSQDELNKEPATMSTNSGTTAPATTGATKIVRALGIVDAIIAFASAEFGGELPVPEGEKIGPEIGKLQDSGKYDATFAGNDEHPHDMFNFKEVAGDVQFVADANGKQTPVFVRHAVKGTRGCDYLPGINAGKIDRKFPKGDDGKTDSFSACGNADLIPWLHSKGVTHVDVVGLVFRICVGSTAIDLAKAGFKVRVVVDATRDLPIDDFQPIIDEMKALGVEFVNVADVLAE